MDMNLYDMLAHLLLAFAECYVFFVLVYAFCGQRRRFQKRRWLLLYLFLTTCIYLGRRLALQHASLPIPVITAWEPLFLLLDLLLLRLFFAAANKLALGLLLGHHFIYIATYALLEQILSHLHPLAMSAGFPFYARLVHEMTFLALVNLGFYLLVVLAVLLYRSQQPPALRPRCILALLLPPALMFLGEFIGYLAVGYTANQYQSLLGGIFLMLINVACWLLYLDLDRRNTRLYYLNKNYGEQQTYYNKILAEQYHIQQRLHDERKHHTHILALLQNRKYEQLHSYISSLGSGLAGVEDAEITGNSDIDAVLNTKKAEARQAGCQIITSGKLPYQLYIDPVDCCILLGNCLENAIAACRETANRDIRIDFIYQKEILLIRVQNAFSAGDNGTGKKAPPAAGHGMGLKIMESVVRKYQGDLAIRQENGLFTAEILLHKPATLPPAQASG